MSMRMCEICCRLNEEKTGTATDIALHQAALYTNLFNKSHHNKLVRGKKKKNLYMSSAGETDF